jgi:hypothetical protein
MHPILAKRVEIPWRRFPWARIRKAVAVLFLAGAIVTGLYVLSAPPIIKAEMKVRIRQGEHFHWPRFYAPLLMGLESDSPVIHGVFRWYFNTIWGCGIIFFSDNSSGKTE